MIPQGYKQTELGIIPEEWTVRQLGDCVNVYDGTHQTPNYVPVGIPFYSVENVTANNFSHTKHISPNEHKILTSRYKIQKGDILMTRIGSIGVCKYVDWDVDASFYVSLALLKPYNIDALYLSMASNATYFKDSILLNSLQFAIPQKINLGNISNVKILVPPIAEQRAIAEALSDVDGLIVALDKKIAKKRLLKQGAMQQLLTGKKRLPGFTDEWVEITFGDYVDIYRGGSPRPIENYITDNPNGVNWIKIGDVKPNDKYINKTEERIIPDGVSRSRWVDVGDFILSNSMSFGRPYILGIDGCIHDGWLVIQNYHNTFDKDYLYYLLCSEDVMMQYMGMAAGSSVKNLNKEKVASLQLCVPTTIEEQQAIATILSDMDNEIADLEAQRDKYRLLKSGMMQKLLTGQIRLKIE